MNRSNFRQRSSFNQGNYKGGSRKRGFNDNRKRNFSSNKRSNAENFEERGDGRIAFTTNQSRFGNMNSNTFQSNRFSRRGFGGNHARFSRRGFRGNQARFSRRGFRGRSRGGANFQANYVPHLNSMAFSNEEESNENDEAITEDKERPRSRGRANFQNRNYMPRFNSTTFSDDDESNKNDDETVREHKRRPRSRGRENFQNRNNSPHFKPTAFSDEDESNKNDDETVREDKRRRSVLKKELIKRKQEKKKRLIIRNLPFQVEEDELKEMFSKFGKVVEAIIPKNTDGKNKGFAFLQFEEFRSTIAAIKSLNYKKIHGRPIAIDYAIPKSKYEHVISARAVTKPDLDTEVKTEVKSEPESADDSRDSNEEDEAVEEEEVTQERKKQGDKKYDAGDKFLEEFGIKSESDDDQSEDSNDDNSSSDDDNMDSGISDEDNKVRKIKKEASPDSNKTQSRSSNDVQEGKTIFVRNISFETTADDLRQAVEVFGSVEYCLLCMDRVTELPRGTAFIKFKNKEDAEKMVEKASESMGEGIYLDGRKLNCIPALSREEAEKKGKERVKERKDKRNLRLLKEGLIMENSEEAKDVSKTDFEKRKKLEIMKKQKLKNLNFFVSDTRLAVHNLPSHYKDQDLRKLFRSVNPSALITEVRVMKDLKKVDANGEPRSKGFGFVAFSQHEDALNALHKLNNNPDTFTPQKRPIVEFSIENHLALLTKKRRQERNRQRTLAKSAHNGKVEDATEEETLPNITDRKSMNKGRKRHRNEYTKEKISNSMPKKDKSTSQKDKKQRRLFNKEKGPEKNLPKINKDKTIKKKKKKPHEMKSVERQF